MQLRQLADRDLRALLALLDGESVAGVREALIVALPELLAPYLSASGELAATLFEDLRAEAGRRGTFYAEVAAAELAGARVDRTARWAVAPLVDDSLESSVGSRLSGSMARAIMDASRDTMALNGGREGTQFQRMPRPGCCAFCGMLASRPTSMAYRSRESASAGSHDSCHCVVVPVYAGTEMAEVAAATRKRYEEMYQQVASEDSTGARAMKETLAAWRAEHGTR